jgi:hypothetical protein
VVNPSPQPPCVIVFASTRINRHYNPEVTAKIASQKTAKLKAIVRNTEDRMAAFYAKKSEQDNNPYRKPEPRAIVLRGDGSYL